MTSVERRNLRNGLLFISPWFVGLGVFLIYPIVTSFYLSFCEYSVLRPAMFIGGENYGELMGDSVFWKSLWNTIVYAAFALPLGTITAVILALLLNARVRGLAVYRTIFFLPSLVPMVALAVLWLWMFNGEYGLVNHMLKVVLSPLGMAPPAWLASTTWSKPAMIIMSVWGVGHSIVIYLAGLQDVPEHLYEAAQIDGASFWQQTWHVTLPMISPVIRFNVIMGIIGVFNLFAVPYVLSPEGSPARSIYFYVMYLFDNAFLHLRMGYASAMAWLLFLLIFALTVVTVVLSRRHVHYGGE